MDIEVYKRDYFIQPNFNIIGPSMFAVRTALLEAVTALRQNIRGKVLDLACGVMPYKDFLMSNGKIDSYYGVDLEPTIYHNQLKPDKYWDGKNIPFESDTFDWVITTEFFEHYFDIGQLLKEIRRVLKKDGSIFFTVPFIWTLHEVPYDEFRYTPYSLEKLLKKAEYDSIEIKALGGFNRSLATMIGLWLDYYPLKAYQKKILKSGLIPFYKFLLKKDFKYKEFQNYQMPSGLYGYAKAAKTK